MSVSRDIATCSNTSDAATCHQILLLICGYTRGMRHGLVLAALLVSGCVEFPEDNTEVPGTEVPDTEVPGSEVPGSETAVADVAVSDTPGVQDTDPVDDTDGPDGTHDVKAPDPDVPDVADGGTDPGSDPGPVVPQPLEACSEGALTLDELWDTDHGWLLDNAASIDGGLDIETTTDAPAFAKLDAAPFFPEAGLHLELTLRSVAENGAAWLGFYSALEPGSTPVGTGIVLTDQEGVAQLALVTPAGTSPGIPIKAHLALAVSLTVAADVTTLSVWSQGAHAGTVVLDTAADDALLGIVFAVVGETHIEVGPVGACLQAGPACTECVGDDPCLSYYCNPLLDCGTQWQDGLCDDGDPCTIEGICEDGNCVAGDAISCDDGEVCTDDACQPGSGCVYQPNVSPCDDEDACTSDDTCGEGSCIGTPVSCDDALSCTEHSCDSESGCVVLFVTGFCVIQGACEVEGARPDPTGCLECQPDDDPLDWSPLASATACDDGDPCLTDDVCDVAGVCSGVALCENNLSCTLDSCTDGDCEYTVLEGTCLIDKACYGGGAPIVGHPCKACDGASGLAANQPDELACGDGLTCVQGHCFTGSCGDTECPTLADHVTTCNAQDHCLYLPADPTAWQPHVAWIWVPPGSFHMGATEADGAQASVLEMPSHDVVHAKGYFLAKWEVTVEVYEACMSDGNCDDPAPLSEDAWGLNTSAQRPGHPQNGIDKARADQVCTFLGGKPVNEAQFEYATNGYGEHRKFQGGTADAPSCENERAWVRNAAEEDGCGTGGTAPVGHFADPANPVGAVDMIGNVNEWVDDCRHDSYGPSTNEIVAPVDGTAWTTNCFSGWMMTRGGGADSSSVVPNYVRNAYRGPGSPTTVSAHLGTRCALEAPDYCAGKDASTPCDDGSVCTTEDTCDGAGQCVGNPLDCGDGDACTVEKCVPWLGCVADGMADCDDGDQCTDDTCEPATGCAFPANDSCPLKGCSSVIGLTGGGTNLWLMDWHTLDKTQLTSSLSYTSDYGVRSHDQEQLAYVTNQGGKKGLYVRDIGGADATAVHVTVSHTYTKVLRPEWTADDTGIVYVAKTASGDGDIYYFDLGLSTITQITNLPNGTGYPSQGEITGHVRSPVGSDVFMALGNRIWRFGWTGIQLTSTAGAEPLSEVRAESSLLDISPSGTTVVFSANYAGARRVFRIDANASSSAAPTQLGNGSDGATYPTFLPNDVILYTVTSGDTSAIWQTSVAGGGSQVYSAPSNFTEVRVWDGRCD
ncbi:MAG: sulfatase activating formylglycine-generating enzyme [Myxococcota bacterium]|jgi:formylglycine-generating enzyme required for sulfatase activity